MTLVKKWIIRFLKFPGLAKFVFVFPLCVPYFGFHISTCIYFLWVSERNLRKKSQYLTNKIMKSKSKMKWKMDGLKWMTQSIDRSSYLRCSVKKVFLEISQNSQENTCARASTCNFVKIVTLAQVFSCEFCNISKNTFFYRTVLESASTLTFQWLLILPLTIDRLWSASFTTK